MNKDISAVVGKMFQNREPLKMSILGKIFGEPSKPEYKLRGLIHTLKNYNLELNETGLHMALRLQDKGANYYELVGLMIAHCMATDLTEHADKMLDTGISIARFSTHYSLAKIVLDDQHNHKRFAEDIYHMILSLTAYEKHSEKLKAARDLCRQAGEDRAVEWVGELA